MLQAPAYTQIDGVTVFADDTLFYKFYLIAPAPSVRLGKDGKPIFLLVKYALSDEDRRANPALAAGGGHLDFDVQFEVTAEQQEKVRVQLQKEVDAAWSRYRTGPAADQARPGVAGTAAAPRVEIGSPTWTSGKVALDAPEAKELVSARVAEGEPSLLAGNIAVFAMDLTPAGATFIEKVLITPTGSGASDLTPLQVRYDLKFWARLPPVKIHVEVDSEKVHQYVKKHLEGRGVDHCTSYDFSNTDIETSTLTASGAVDVHIDTGSASLPEEVVSELRRYAFDLVKQMVESSFFTDAPPAGAAPAGDPKAAVPGTKYLKQTYDGATMKIRLDLEQRSVVEWAIHPQATLETFFKGMSAKELESFVRVIDLDDDYWKNLELTARAFTDFTDAVVANVEAEVHYEGTDENGDRREKNQTFTFTSNAPERWTPSLIGSEREYSYRYRVGFKGRDAGDFTAWVRTSSPQLNISVPDPGKINVQILAGDVDFASLVEHVQVKLAYEDPAAGVPLEDYTVVLLPTKQEDRYSRLIYKPWNKPLRYRVRFKLKSGEVREDELWREESGRQILINQPVTDVLKVNLLPVGDGWDDVIQAIVQLWYDDDASHYHVTDTLVLKSRDEFRSWRVPLKNKNLRSFDYAWKVSYKSGAFPQAARRTATGDETIPIVIKRLGINVLILPDVLDFAACPITEVSCHYAAAGVRSDETFVFRDKTPQTWKIQAPEGAPVDFTYQVTHSPAGRDPVTRPEVHETDTVVVLPAYHAPKAGTLSVQILGSLVDFAATPIVTLDLRYDDEENGVHEIGALTLTDKKSLTWDLAVKDGAHKRFGYVVTYYTPDGTPHASELKYQDVPRIILANLST